MAEASHRDEHWQLLEQRMRLDRVIPYVGAGISTTQLRGWLSLLARLEGKPEPSKCNVCSETPQFDLDAPARADVLKLDHGPRLRTMVRDSLAWKEGGLDTQHPDLPDHKLLARGDWPAILTPNWDQFIERAWGGLDSAEGGKVGGGIPVRYRGGASRLLAELQARVWPGPVFKFHGHLDDPENENDPESEDDAQPDEFVFGHGEYRRLMARGIELKAAFTYLLTEYSLLFYGTSLTDPDLLGLLDDVQERLGHVAGPHFLLTAEPVTAGRRRFLFQRYAIHTICEAGEWTALLTRLDEKRQSALGRCRGSGVDSVRIRRGDLTVALEAAKMEPLHEWDRGAACVASVYVNRDGSVPTSQSGGTWRALKKDRPALVEVAKNHEIAPGECAGLASDAWLVVGQRRGGFATPWHVHDACVHLFKRLQGEGATQVVMGLPGTGPSGLPRRAVLDAVLHALGQAHRKGTELRVKVCIPPDWDDPLAPNLVDDAANGRLDVLGPINRGAAGTRMLHVVYQARDGAGGTRDALASLLVQADDDLGTLAKRLPGFPAALAPESLRLHPPESIKNPEWVSTTKLGHATDQLVVEIISDPSPALSR